MPFIQINILMNNFYSKFIPYTQIGMQNNTSKLLVIFLAMTCVLSLNLRNRHQDTILGSKELHLMKPVEHDPSSTYSSYKASLDAIRDGIVLNPPSALPTSSIPVTTFTSSECKIMTPSEKDQLSIEVLLIKNKLNLLEKQLEALPINGSNYKTRLDSKNQQTYLETIKDILESNCSEEVTLRQSQFQTNLNNDRWILGDLSFQDVVKKYSQRSMTNKFVTNCPDERPFYNKIQGCFNCDNIEEYFNLEEEKCEKCEEGYTVNINQRICERQKVAGKNETHPANETKVNATPNATHPANQTKTNATHPANETKTNATHPANETKVNATPNATHPANQTKTNATHPANETKTNATHPANETKVNATPNATHPANQTKTNATHPANETKTNATHPANETKVNATPNATHPANQTKTNATHPANETKTNATHPANETKNNATLTSNLTKTNTSSPNASISNITKANTTVSQPLPTLSKPNSSNLLVSDRILISSGTLPANSSKDVPCPYETPFYNGSTCIQCNAPNNLFDLSKKVCTSCPDQFIFNQATNKCDKLNNDFLTNLNASRLVNAGMPSSYWTYVQDQIKAKNTSVTNCPTSKPYYNGKECLNCTGATQFFNLETRKCQSCSGNFTYDETQRDCLDNTNSEYGVSGSTLKMSSTLFAHQKQLLQRMHSLSRQNRHQVNLSQ